MLLNWKLIQSKIIHENNWFSLRADTCEMPSGKRITPYYVIDYPDWVNIIALTKSNEVILVKQYRHAIQATILELPSGIIEKDDESPMAAAKRELLEETGYLFRDFELIGTLSPNAACQSNMTYCYLASNEKKIQQQQLDPLEQLEIECVPLDKFISMAKNGEFVQALHLGATFYFLCKLGVI